MSATWEKIHEARARANVCQTNIEAGMEALFEEAEPTSPDYALLLIAATVVDSLRMLDARLEELCLHVGAKG